MTCCVIGKGRRSRIEDILPKPKVCLSILNFSLYVVFLTKLQKGKPLTKSSPLLCQRMDTSYLKLLKEWLPLFTV
jgi:hypothetical protein